jgi:dTDP-4-dehydrorhamnose reductase
VVLWRGSTVTEILVFGADSLVGSDFVASTRYTVTAAGRVDPRSVGIPIERFLSLDATHGDQIERAVHDSGADAVINFTAATEVDMAERERPLGTPTSAEGRTFALNVLAPAVMAAAARKRGTHFVTLSTDFVFDGTNGPYAESSAPSEWSESVGWYGWTKGEGERRALEADPGAAIVRISYPYRSNFPRKTDFARNILSRRAAGSLPPLFTDQVVTPTWIPDVSRALEYIVRVHAKGRFHVASPELTSPWEFGTTLVHALEGRPPELTKGSMEAYLARPGVTPRPRRGGLLTERLPAAGVGLTNWRDGIAAICREAGSA